MGVGSRKPPPEIHTSDRVLFKRCRRKWFWASPLQQNLRPIEEEPGPLWLGSGFHFALEDYHGHRRFKTPDRALRAYYGSFRPSQMPTDHEELFDLGRRMLIYYYKYWLPRRKEEFKTLWIDGDPQVEVQWKIRLDTIKHRKVFYSGTFDRIVVDPYGRLWVMDYKTAKQFDTSKLETDLQVTAYTWAARKLFGDRVEGVVYVQFKKDWPKPPTLLANGEFSLNKNQATTHAIYRKALINKYDKVPSRYVEFLNHLARLESAEGDRFIRWDLVRRNEDSTWSEEMNMELEVKDMINPRLKIYPNPTRDCAWDCPFRSPCIALDDGSDSNFLIREGYAPREDTRHDWRKRLQWPLSEEEKPSEIELLDVVTMPGK